jgi:hypothetical protein
MCGTFNSTRRALMLGLWFSFLTIQIVQTDPVQLRILPEVEKDEQVNEQGSTLTLDCIDEDSNSTLENSFDQKWKHPQSEVIQNDLDKLLSFECRHS